MALYNVLKAAVVPSGVDLEDIAHSDWMAMKCTSSIAMASKSLHPVTSKDIFVKSYYFPCGSQARLPLEAITNMCFLSREEGPPTISWGSIDGKIWWALNEKRCRKAESQNNVVVHEPHHRPRLIGFSVRNKHRFLAAVHAFDGFPVEISSPPI
ncbi:unnamed protein product [Nippostrongylus brasiliensis]|uniref:FBA_3 domain-containing protein n=1 Tax=Nippostrongylus brasiliensis TaxID=27835 RepID=A0A0N4XW53_NIPBR|nr:unnamed protein product [Nippostrongylus brasiliensis]